MSIRYTVFQLWAAGIILSTEGQKWCADHAPGMAPQPSETWTPNRLGDALRLALRDAELGGLCKADIEDGEAFIRGMVDRARVLLVVRDMPGGQ